MDSRAWLVGLGLLASALAALLVADLAGGARRETDGGRIVPEWSAGDVRAIRLERSGLPPVLLERSRSGPGQKSSPGAPTAPAAADPGWRLRLPSGTAVPVDPAALRDLTGTIEMLAATRRDPAPITAPRLTIVLERDGGPPIRLLLAAAGPGPTDRVWLARAGQGGRFLIDGYAARALDVGVDPLRERRPLHGRLDGVGRIEVATGQRTAILTGPPWRIELPGGLARAAAARVQDLLDRARDLRIASFTDGPPASPDPGSPLAAAHGPVRVSFTGGAGRVEIVYLGGCPGQPTLALADTPIGRGCLPAPDAADRLADPDVWIDRDLVGVPTDRVSHIQLERGGRAIDVERADRPDVLRDWLARWRVAAAGPVVAAADLHPLATIDLTVDGGGHQRLAIGRAGAALAARREDEPVALVLQPGADGMLDPSPHRFRSLDLLTREPTALRAAIAHRGARLVESIVRGDTLEEWRALAPTGSEVPAAAIESLRQAVGFLRAERFLAASAGPAHRLAPPRRTVDLVLDPEPGGSAPERHVLEIGAAIPGRGCAARLDRAPAVFELSAARCAALLGPWTAAQRAP